MNLSNKAYWDKAALRNPFSATRARWTESDFKLRKDGSIIVEFDFTLRQDDVIVDFGCGPSYAAKFIAPFVAKYIGIDYSENMLRLAARQNTQYKNAEWLLSDGQSLPLPDASADVLVSELVFQHVYEDRELGDVIATKLLCDCVRVLKPNGRLGIQMPCSEHFKYGPNNNDIVRVARQLGCDVFYGYKPYYYYLFRNIVFPHGEKT